MMMIDSNGVQVDHELSDAKAIGILFDAIRDVYVVNNSCLSYKDYDLYININDMRIIDPKEQYIKFYSEGNKVLSITKPLFSPCPQPRPTIEGWLVDGWNNYHNTQTGVSKYNSLGVEFKADSERVRDYRAWINLRSRWVEKQLKLEKIANYFNTFSDLVDDFRANYDAKELVLAGGCLQFPQLDIPVNHPIVGQKVVIRYEDLVNNIISIYYENEPLLLETNFLHRLHGKLKDTKNESVINTGHINDIIAALDSFDINLMDEAALLIFLREAIHRLSPNGEVLIGQVEETKENYPVVVDRSVVLVCRKRSDGLADFLEKIKTDIYRNGKVPRHLLALCGRLKTHKIEYTEPKTIQEKIQAIGGNYTDILLTKPSNKEQLQIIRAVEKNDSIVVQGPPGTGKTHTISNLMGHFLAEGKKILVVSEKTKALEVIQDKLEPEIRSLCVPILYGNTRKFEEAVDRIISQNSKLSADGLEQEILDTSTKRNRIIEKINTAREKLYHLRNKQIADIVYDNKTYSLIDIGKFLADNIELANVIPTPVKRVDVMPVTRNDLLQLLANNTAISAEEEMELSLQLPEFEELIPESYFDDVCNDRAVYDEQMTALRTKLSGNIDFDYASKSIKVDGITIIDNPDEEKIENVESLLRAQPVLEPWLVEVCLAERKGLGFYNRWLMVADAIDEFSRRYNNYLVTKLRFDISIKDQFDVENVLLALNNCIAGGKSGKFSFFDKLVNSDVKLIEQAVFVNGKVIDCFDDCKPAAEYCSLIQQEKELRRIWQQVFGNTDALYSKVDIGYVEKISKDIRFALDWFNVNYRQIENACKDANWAGIEFRFDDAQNRVNVFEEFYKALIARIDAYIFASKLMLLGIEIHNRIKTYLNVLERVNLSSSVMCRELIDALNNYDADAYRTAVGKYKRTLNKKSIYLERKRLFDHLEQYAPKWSEAIKNRQGIYDTTFLDVNFDSAWKWQQFNMIVKELYAESEDSLLDDIKDSCLQLHNLTVDLVCKKAWYANVKVCSTDARIKQALNDSKIINRSIGLGKGKNIQFYLKQSKENMVVCQLAVPAWVMSVHDALQRFDPIKNHFDVLIIDEASQSSSNVLALTYMADKVIIVGDDKQVTPSAVGTKKDEELNILGKHLKGIVDNYSKFCKDVSVYEVMSGVSDSKCLLEHFRCMPAIIGFSNRYYYDNAIRPLRDTQDCDIDTNVINYRIRGRRVGDVNEDEARNIVALIKACIEQPEYKNKTIGIIPMQGSAQGERIRNLMRRKISRKLMDDHNILCGESAIFQGDERDVVFMSLIDDDSTIKTVRSGANRGTYDQRYNVAVSRAKDQLWIVNSIDHLKLDPDDIRYRLLDFVDNYSGYLEQQNEISRLSESPFELEVANYLHSRGYNIKQQYSVGAYRIDIVVFYGDKRIAVECDGELYHSGTDKILADMNREDILKRVGNWEFIRIRGGAYYKDKKLELKNLEKRLEENGFFPEDRAVHQSFGADEDELVQRIKARAQELMEEWFSDAPKDKVDSENVGMENLSDEKGDSGNEETEKFNSDVYEQGIDAGIQVLKRLRKENKGNFVTWSKAMIDRIGYRVKPWLGSLYETIETLAMNNVPYDPKVVVAMSKFALAHYGQGSKTFESQYNDLVNLVGEEKAKQYRPTLEAAYAGLQRWEADMIQEWNEKQKAAADK